MKNKTSALLTKALVRLEIEQLRSYIEQLIKTSECRFGTKRMVAYIVILNPIPHEGEQSILWEGAIGEADASKWPAGKNYREFALLKARASFAHKKANHLILKDSPHLLSIGDFKYGGGEYRDGIAVGTSGLEWFVDYAVSATVASVLQAASIGNFEREMRNPSFTL